MKSLQGQIHFNVISHKDQQQHYKEGWLYMYYVTAMKYV